MADVVNETLRTLNDARARSDSCLVSFSGGKDSMVVMDLALRTFPRVEACFMYTVPGLQQCEMQLEMAEKRWGIKIRQYPHWLTGRWAKFGYYCDPKLKNENLPEWSMNEIYELAMYDARTTIVMTGSKASDNPWRRRRMQRQSASNAEIIMPLASWLKMDVLAYLKRRNIPLPPADGRTATGVDLSDAFLLWCHKTWPEDFMKIAEYFPYCPSVIWRQKFFFEKGGASAA